MQHFIGFYLLEFKLEFGLLLLRVFAGTVYRTAPK